MKACAAVLFAMALSAPAGAQWINYKTPGVPRLPDGSPNLSAPPPRTADGTPDLSGVWQSGRAADYGYDADITRTLKPGDVQPWALALRMKRVQDFRKDSPLAHCLPVSVPYLNFRGLSRMVQTPALLLVMYESPNSPFRTIFTDGRALPNDMNPTWLGYSVGHWEQDTLVVMSAGFNDRGWLDVGGHPQTESLRLTERFRRRDYGHLDLDVTVDDPKVFTKAFTLHVEKTLAPDDDLLEDVCEDDDTHAHLTGGVTVGPATLAKYAGVYELAGHEIKVSVMGGQLIIEDTASPLDRLFVAATETTFSSSVSQASVEFVRDARGDVTSFVRRIGAREERAFRKP